MDIVDIKNVFGYEKDFKDIEIKKDKIRNYEHKKIKFKSSITSKYEENNFVYGYIFYPKKDYNKKNILTILPVHEVFPFFDYTLAFYFLNYGKL